MARHGNNLLRNPNRPAIPLNALGQKDPRFSGGPLGFIAQDPKAFAKGIASAPFTVAPDILGLLQQGSNALGNMAQERLGLPQVSFNALSGDPIRESIGLDIESPQGFLGEVASPIGTIAKGLGIATKAVVSGAKLAGGFPLAPIGLWLSGADFQARGGRIVKMTPDEFLANAKPLKIDDISRENINDLKQHITDGGELDPLELFAGDKLSVRNSDGRHRAIAAKELGIDEVPVLDFRGSQQ